MAFNLMLIINLIIIISYSIIIYSIFPFIYFTIILLGFRYLASSIPLISLAGVAIGVGLIFSILIFAICRNAFDIDAAFTNFNLVSFLYIS